jgi:hypothetical protein
MGRASVASPSPARGIMAEYRRSTDGRMQQRALAL